MRPFLYILLLILPWKGFAGSFPIQIIRGYIITEARIEGRQVLVILDTGAPGLVLNNKYYSSPDMQPQTCMGINGSFECKSRRVDQWNWLGITYRKTSARLSDLSFLESKLNRKIDALIGLSVLNDFYVTIDYDRNEIWLNKDLPNLKSGSFSRFQYVDHLPVIACKVNGEKKLLGLDTGSEDNHLFRFPDPDPSLIAQAIPVCVTGTENVRDIKHILAMELEVVSLETDYVSSFIVDLLDKGFFADDLFAGILGQRFLSQFNLIIHPGKQRILFAPREPIPSLLAVSAP